MVDSRPARCKIWNVPHSTSYYRDGDANNKINNEKLNISFPSSDTV